jgi:hypothetical protein
MARHFKGVPGGATMHLGVLARQRGRDSWLKTAMDRMEASKGAWAGKGPNKHVGQQACEQLQGTGFTKKQVYDRRDKLSRQLVKVK